jgi:glycosyltransferase involved in cell wall biosynthesis
MSGMRFSIVINCYNQRQFIREAVDSALAQQHPLKETIVVDDGSTDGTGELLKEYGNSIRLLRLPTNVGMLEARNIGAALATGEYLAFLDGDDVFMPWAMEIYERVVTRYHPKIILARRRWFEGSVPLVVSHDFPNRIDFIKFANLMEKDRAVGSSLTTFVVEREAFNRVNGVSRDVPYLDVIDLSGKMGFSGLTILICFPRTLFYRIHTSNISHNVSSIVRACFRLIEKERSGEYAGGREHRFERYAWLGGVVTFWVKSGLRAGAYREALCLAAKAWLMILCAVVRRLVVLINGRRCVETFNLILSSGAAVKAKPDIP